MKRMEIFCSSPASTAICSSLDHRSMVRRGTRPIDDHRHNSSTPYASSSINSKSSYFEKIRKITSSSSTKHNDNFRRKSSADEYSSAAGYRKKYDDYLRRKSSADASDVRGKRTTPTGGGGGGGSSSCRYLLSDKVPYIDWISDSDAMVIDSVNQHFKPNYKPTTSINDPPATRSSYYDHHDLILDKDRASVRTNNVKSSRLSSSNVSSPSPALNKASSSARSCDQVVVLWVSIHCKGCEGKVRKHISKMEGVTSFSIDLATKKVTVIGNVTPLGVLASLSKVKNAQLWPSSTSSRTIVID